MFGQREYFCSDCNVKFFNIFQNDGRNSHCSYCGNSSIQETGIVIKIEGDQIVTYDNEQEISRRTARQI